MTALIRDDLQKVFDNLTLSTAHAGLMLERKLSKYEDGGEKNIKNKLIQTISGIQPCELYNLAFQRWLSIAAKENQFVTAVAIIDGRLFTGLSTGGSLETGVITQHTYGMPMIAGSSVKGAVRQYAEAIQLNGGTLSILFGHGEDDPKYDQDGNMLDDMAGYLVWHDAWWIPNSGEKYPFAKEIVTVHHQDYYNGAQAEATDFDSPVPNQQVAVQGSFFFVIEGDPKWAEFAKVLLEKVLYENGLGAKASSGYGYFMKDDALSQKISQTLKDIKENEEKIRKAEELENELVGLSDHQKFIKKLSAHLPAENTWKNKPNVEVVIVVDEKKYKFIDIYNLITEWENKEDIQKGIDFLEVNLKIWSGKPLGKNERWKARINPLKEKLSK